MNVYSNSGPESSKQSAFRAPSAWVPLGLSAAALALLFGYLVTGPHAPDMVQDHGIVREDESAAARVWQVLMLLQVGASVAFAALWLPRDPRRAAMMLVCHAIGFVTAATPVYLFEHGYFA